MKSAQALEAIANNLKSHNFMDLTKRGYQTNFKYKNIRNLFQSTKMFFNQVKIFLNLIFILEEAILKLQRNFANQTS